SVTNRSKARLEHEHSLITETITEERMSGHFIDPSIVSLDPPRFHIWFHGTETLYLNKTILRKSSLVNVP
ncbi:MAG: hypothetical protein ACP5VS_17410, partial [Desulfomonilaceae bacterium]